MTTYDNTNRGLLSKNDRKDTEQQPDYRGSINVDGREYWLSAWVKEGREGSKFEGRKYFSLSVQPKDDAPAQSYASAPAPAPAAAPARRMSQAEQDARAIADRRAREAQQAQPKPVSGTGFDSMDDDIPF